MARKPGTPTPADQQPQLDALRAEVTKLRADQARLLARIEALEARLAPTPVPYEPPSAPVSKPAPPPLPTPQRAEHPRPSAKAIELASMPARSIGDLRTRIYQNCPRTLDTSQRWEDTIAVTEEAIALVLARSPREESLSQDDQNRLFRLRGLADVARGGLSKALGETG